MTNNLYPIVLDPDYYTYSWIDEETLIVFDDYVEENQPQQLIVDSFGYRPGGMRRFVCNLVPKEEHDWYGPIYKIDKDNEANVYESKNTSRGYLESMIKRN